MVEGRGRDENQDVAQDAEENDPHVQPHHRSKSTNRPEHHLHLGTAASHAKSNPRIQRHCSFFVFFQTAELNSVIESRYGLRTDLKSEIIHSLLLLMSLLLLLMMLLFSDTVPAWVYVKIKIKILKNLFLCVVGQIRKKSLKLAVSKLHFTEK